MDTSALEVINPHAQGLDVSHLDLSDLFPTIDPEFQPFGHRVIVQVRRVVEMSKGGIIMPKAAQETEAYNGQVGRLIAMGPLAFKNRSTAQPWPEGVWAKVGDFVKVPRWGGDRWTVDPGDGMGNVSLAVLADSDLIGAYSGDVRKVRAHLS